MRKRRNTTLTAFACSRPWSQRRSTSISGTSWWCSTWTRSSRRAWVSMMRRERLRSRNCESLASPRSMNSGIRRHKVLSNSLSFSKWSMSLTYRARRWYSLKRICNLQSWGWLSRKHVWTIIRTRRSLRKPSSATTKRDKNTCATRLSRSLTRWCTSQRPQNKKKKKALILTTIESRSRIQTYLAPRISNK